MCKFMSIVFNVIQKSQLLRSHYFFSFSTLLLLIFVVASTLFALAYHSKSTQASSSFSFTVASDYGRTNYTTANLNYIAHSGASFNLALGDLNYDPTHVSASAWSSYVKSHLPSSFPFELIAGNHDTSQVSALAVDMPDHIGNISGPDAREYYFDYPPSAPLARFIMISPGGVAGGYSYSKGSSHYNWLSQNIDSARAANIHWVIVAMHEHCIVAGSQACTIGSALEDLLVSKKVDLILQGHKRSYQASKQLALNGTTCKTIQVNGYNPNCVVNATTLLTRC